LGKLEIWKTIAQKPLNAAIEPIRPERDIDLGTIRFQERQHTRRVRYVADVHRLP
jgi:hypothetical protein